MAWTDRVGPGGQAPDHDEQQPKTLGERPARGPEFRLTLAAVRLCALLVPLALSAGWFAARGPGLAAAAIGVVLVAAQLLCSAAVLAACARRGGMALLIGGYGGVIGRLALTAAVLAALLDVRGIHMPTLAITAIVLTLAVLASESWHLWRDPRLHWIESRPAATRGSATLERTSV